MSADDRGGTFGKQSANAMVKPGKKKKGKNANVGKRN